MLANGMIRGESVDIFGSFAFPVFHEPWQVKNMVEIIIH